MALTAGIVGLPNVGKSTLFNAITNAQVEAANYPFATIDPNIGVVEVPDYRLDKLTEMIEPKKTVPTTFGFTDIAGLVKGASRGEGLGNKFLGNIRETDAICEVVRCFRDKDVTHVDGDVDPIRDIETINLELIFADLETVERRIGRLAKKAQSGDKDAKIEITILEKLKATLEANKSARTIDFSKEEISFSVLVADLNNYLYDGGVVFFVVYIGYGGLAKQIYYAALPPIKIRVLLSEAIGQKSKTIKLKKFPNDPNEKAMVFFNCWEDCQKQSSFSSAKLFSLEELENQGVLEGITFSVSTVGNISPKTALFSNEVYLYANIKGSSIPQPLEAIPRNLTTSEERPAQIAVGERIFYDKVRICQNAHVTTTTFGESFSLTIRGDGSPAKVNYRNSTKIRTLSVDLDFMLAYISQGAFQYNGINFPFDKTGTDLSKFSLKDEVKRLTYIKKIVQMLDILGCKNVFDNGIMRSKNF